MSTLGYHHTEEARKRISDAFKGKKRPDWVKAKISASKMNHQTSDEAKKRMSESHKGLLVGSANHNFGKPLPEEVKKKLSDTMKGRHLTEETKRKLAENCPMKLPEMRERHKALLNRPDIKKKMSESHLIDGIRITPYCYKFNDSLKASIRERFGHTCFVCGKREEDRAHHIHHIDYNKNSICDGRVWPLLPLCAACHAKTGHYRHYYFNLLINYWAMNSEINFEVLNAERFIFYTSWSPVAARRRG